MPKKKKNTIIDIICIDVIVIGKYKPKNFSFLRSIFIKFSNFFIKVAIKSYKCV